MAKACIDSGFSSVMLDGSHHSFDESVRLAKQVVDYARERDVTVEGELGVLAGVEDEVSAAESHYTRPEEVEAFVERTGADSLAISIGTSHGAHKFKLEPGEAIPPLRFDILEAIEKRLPGYPIVLHGASSFSPGRMPSYKSVSCILDISSPRFPANIEINVKNSLYFEIFIKINKNY